MSSFVERNVSRRQAITGLGAGAVGLALARSGWRRAASAQEPEVERSVSYGTAGDTDLLLDAHIPPSTGELRPAVILIHGGRWSQFIATRVDYSQDARRFALAGYVTFNIDYRLLTSVPGENAWPAQLDDVQRAVRWVRANAATYDVDPERIGAYGHSAGGHLASMLAVRDTRDNSDAELASFSSRVQCAATVAGHFDLTIPYLTQDDNDVVVKLLGGTADEEPDAYRDASPITWVDAESSPHLIIYGAADQLNPVAQGRNMVASLQEGGVEHVYVEYPDGDHFTPARWADAGPWSLTFFERHLGA
ncbi:MAG: alpha/beta hydrolase [Thermomicrobiales bacterium]|nr:alpha/beta hydrolase [Thermomicrobiales bacterium]